MRAFAITFILVSATFLFAAVPDAGVLPSFQAFCNDGDGPLSGWMSSRYDAYIIGRDHELANRGHRWDILTQQGETVTRTPICARIGDGERAGTMKLENTCGQCVRFTVSRTDEKGKVNAREIKIDSKKTRYFRKLPNTVIKVEGERDCQ